MKVFIGQSFSENDKQLVDSIVSFLAKKEIICGSGEPAQNKPISVKVKEGIDGCDLFIGIFTKRERVLTAVTLDCIQFNKSKMKYSTSSWVIQESGYALGKGKPVLLLVENGIHNFPGLQGDEEVIYFDKSSMSDLKLKLTEMLEGHRFKGFVSKQEPEQMAVSEEKKTEVDDDKKLRKEDGQEDNGFSEFFEAWHAGDVKKMDSVYTEKYRPTLKEESEQIFYDCFLLRVKYCKGDEKALEQLIEMAKSATDPQVFHAIGLCYGHFKNYPVAISWFEKSMGVSKTISEKTLSITQIARCFRDLNGGNEAINYLLEAIDKNEEFGNQADVFEALASFAKQI